MIHDGRIEGSYSTEHQCSSRGLCSPSFHSASPAALAAAIASADVGTRTCPLEPTEWVGGQLTAPPVSAVDRAWREVRTIDVGALDKEVANVSSLNRNQVGAFIVFAAGTLASLVTQMSSAFAASKIFFARACSSDVSV